MAVTHPPQNQLSLLPEPSWRLDDRTRQIGRNGVASAREALRAARSSQHGSATAAERAA